MYCNVKNLNPKLTPVLLHQENLKKVSKIQLTAILLLMNYFDSGKVKMLNARFCKIAL